MNNKIHKFKFWRDHFMVISDFLVVILSRSVCWNQLMLFKWTKLDVAVSPSASPSSVSVSHSQTPGRFYWCSTFGFFMNRMPLTESGSMNQSPEGWKTTGLPHVHATLFITMFISHNFSICSWKWPSRNYDDCFHALPLSLFFLILAWLNLHESQQLLL